MKTVDQVISVSGFLCDKHIRAALDDGFLIDQGSWDASFIRHASYSLRLGFQVRVKPITPEREEDNAFIIRNLTKDALLEIQPGEIALLYTWEHLNLPSNMLAFSVARGLLFADALTPENTYVDPGFVGNIYITIVNTSNRVIRLKQGMPIARMFFYKLTDCVDVPFRPSAADGIDQQLSSMPHSLVTSADKCKQLDNTALLQAVRALPMYGNHIAELFSRTERYQGKLNIELLVAVPVALLWPIVVSLLVSDAQLVAKAASYGIGVSQSLVAAAVGATVAFLYRRIRKTR